VTLGVSTGDELDRSSLADLRSVDFRSTDRDFWADESAIYRRLTAVVAGLDDGAWQLPGAAKSDAGGPDWSLHEHVGHLVDWQTIAIDYVTARLSGRPWPNDEDFEGGDFDRFNESRRPRFASTPPEEIRRQLSDGRARLLDLARRLPMDTIRSDDGWGWVYMVLHGHYLDHLAVIEPWADDLRRRQIEGDPFAADPRPAGDGSTEAVAGFWSTHDRVFRQFDELIRPVPLDRWEEAGPTIDWTLKDHVGHLARWFDEGADVIERQRATGVWQPALVEGLDAWNEREVAAARDLSPAEALARFDAGHRRLQAAAKAMAAEELASPEAGDWTYECLHGHVRQHLAMIGPWCIRAVSSRTASERTRNSSGEAISLAD
jgi:hypothetical protein